MQCRLCQRYYFEGHRYGTCLLLNVPVDGHSPMCCLGTAAFAVETVLPPRSPAPLS